MTTKKKELTERIIAVTEEIYENYPELSIYIEEMTDTMSADADPDVNRRKLQAYYESLLEMIKNYKQQHDVKEKEALFKGVKIIRAGKKNLKK